MRWHSVLTVLVVVAFAVLAGWAFVRTTPTRVVDGPAANQLAEGLGSNPNGDALADPGRASNRPQKAPEGRPSAADLLKQYEQANKELDRAKEPIKDLDGALPAAPPLPDGAAEEVRKRVRENLENYNKRITDPAYQKEQIDGEHRRALHRASERSEKWLGSVPEAPENIEVENADELRARFVSGYLGILDSFFAKKLGGDDHASQAQALVTLLEGLLRYAGTELWSPDELKDRAQRALSDAGVWPLTAMALSHSKRSLALPLNSVRAISLWAAHDEMGDRIVRWASEQLAPVQASVLLQLVVVAAMDLGPSAVHHAGNAVLKTLSASIPRWAQARQLAGAAIVAASLEDLSAVILCGCDEHGLPGCMDHLTSVTAGLAIVFRQEVNTDRVNRIDAVLAGVRLAVVRRVLRDRNANAIEAALLDGANGELAQQVDAPSLPVVEFEQVLALPDSWKSLALLYPARRLLTGRQDIVTTDTGRLAELLRAGKWTSEIESQLDQLGGSAVPALSAALTVESGRDAAEIALRAYSQLCSTRHHALLNAGLSEADHRSFRLAFAKLLSDLLALSHGDRAQKWGSAKPQFTMLSSAFTSKPSPERHFLACCAFDDGTLSASLVACVSFYVKGPLALVSPGDSRLGWEAAMSAPLEIGLHVNPELAREFLKWSTTTHADQWEKSGSILGELVARMSGLRVPADMVASPKAWLRVLGVAPDFNMYE